MPRIQCLRGPQTDVYVGGIAYNFVTDEHGRAVANVPNQLHAQCFLSIEHYRLVPDDMILGDAVETEHVVDDDDPGVVVQIVEPGKDAAIVTEQTNDAAGELGIVPPESAGNGDEGKSEDDNSDDDADKNGENADTDAADGDQDGQKGEENPRPNGEPGEQPKAPEGEGTTETPAADAADAPKPEKKRAGRPKKADAAAKPNAE
ncbi:hypothetical protein I2750_19725 [Bacillus sp. PR5]|nr:hypothetical protein [Bacillus sp. PR5]